VQYRRGEYYFMRRRNSARPENAYSAVAGRGTGSSFYELALYKLGWTFYKQDLYEEALQKYVALLDYKVSIGYDFDQAHEEDEERRVRRYLPGHQPELQQPSAGRRPSGQYFSNFGTRPMRTASTATWRALPG